MATSLYLQFVFMAILAILSPGPGVLRSVTNALNFGFKRACIGILGLSMGVFCVATISATSLGAILGASELAFNILKYIGALYLIYMGVKMWLAPSVALKTENVRVVSNRKLFLEGIFFQFSNPKALAFFLSVFPLFIDRSQPYVPQFAGLVITFCGLLILIHGIYAYFANAIQGFLKTGHGGQWLNRIGGTAFIGFGLLLAQSKKAPT